MSLVVRVIAPTGRDAELITNLLNRSGVPSETVSFASLDLNAASAAPIGPLLIAEEALRPEVVRHLAEFLHHQPPWSDLPILILTGSGRETMRGPDLQGERAALGSPVLLERPIRSATLISSVKAALRARIKQYEVRDVVAELRHEREVLEAMLDNLPVGVVLSRASGEIIARHHGETPWGSQSTIKRQTGQERDSLFAVPPTKRGSKALSENSARSL